MIRTFLSLVVAGAAFLIARPCTGAWVKYRSADETFLVEPESNASQEFVVERERAFYLAQRDFYDDFDDGATRSPKMKPTRARFRHEWHTNVPTSPTSFPTHVSEDWSFLDSIGGPAVADARDGRVVVYVVDTGCDVTHPLLVNVELGPSFVPDEPTSQDFHGHGSHVAGIVAKSNPHAHIVCLKVFDRNGLGYTLPVVKAVRHAQKECKRAKCVINFSGGATDSNLIARVMNDAVMKHDIVVVAPVGNYQQGACRFSPGNAQFVLGVGACDHRDRHLYADLSGFGPCTRVVAPGIDIVSAFVQPWIWRARSGTSMAAPLVAAAAALIRAREPKFSAFPDVYNVIVDNAVSVLRNVPPNTPNKMLQMDAKLRRIEQPESAPRLFPAQWRDISCLEFEARLPLALVFGTRVVRVDSVGIASAHGNVARATADHGTYRIVRQDDHVALFENGEVVWTHKSDGAIGLSYGTYTDFRTCPDPTLPIHVPCHQLDGAECHAPCIWHGDVVGCRRALYCNLTSPIACRKSPLCQWTPNNACRRKPSR